MADRVIETNSSPLATDQRGISLDGPAKATTRPGNIDASPWAIFVASATVLVCVVISSKVLSRTFTPKYAVDLVVAAVGLVPLILSLRPGRRSIASLGAVGFVAIALVSALTSAAPNIGIFGLYDWGTGWLMWLAAAGAFAIGTQLAPSDVRWVKWGVVVGAVANAILAIYQAVGNPTNPTLGPYQGNQADGFLGNPVHLEALLLAAIVIVSLPAAHSWKSLRRAVPLLLLLAVALEFSDERLGILVIVVLGLLLAVWRRLPGIAAWVAIAAGYAIGYFGSHTTLGARVSQGTGGVGISERFEIWKAAMRALTHHLLLGAGPGEFQGATSPYITAKLARQLGPNTLFADGHDIVVEVVVTTGIVGLLALAVWILGAFARARNVLALGALAMFIVELVEPLNIAITVIAFLMLGSSGVKWPGRSGEGEERNRTPALALGGRIATAVLVVAALVLGGTMLLGDAALAKAPPAGYVQADANQANTLLPYWPQSASATGLYESYLSAVTHVAATRRQDALRSIRDDEQAVGRDPGDPSFWTQLGRTEGLLGRVSRANADFRRALKDDPWYAGGLEGLGLVATQRHEWSLAIADFSTELRVLPTGAEATTAAQDLSAARHHRQVPRT